MPRSATMNRPSSTRGGETGTWRTLPFLMPGTYRSSGVVARSCFPKSIATVSSTSEGHRRPNRWGLLTFALSIDCEKISARSVRSGRRGAGTSRNDKYSTL
jgi:hypothetical protein